ncbi:unnamed protein product, partial [Sphacelaria rigidula]
IAYSKDTPEARGGLMAAPYDLSHEQADAILGLRLARLTSMEEGKLREEAADLKASMERYGGVPFFGSDFIKEFCND